MKKYYLILALGFVCLAACQKDELEEEIIQTEELEAVPEEYFRAEVDGESYEADDPSLIKGTVYPSYNSGVINFDFSGEWIDESKDIDFYKAFTFKVCFYDGPGTYYTGTTKTVSWAMYWSDYGLWENHYEYGNEPGTVVVTNATDKYVEGTFEFEAYNNYSETTVYVKGEFGLILESVEDYNK